MQRTLVSLKRLWTEASSQGPLATSLLHVTGAGHRRTSILLPRSLHSSSLFQPGEQVALNNLRDNPGATKQAKRKGRGIGSGLGKTAGRGHKGQKARAGRSPREGFEGGQTPLRLRLPKRGFHNFTSLTYTPLNLGRVQQLIDSGRLDVGQRVVTMRDLLNAGAVYKQSVHNMAPGIKLLAEGADKLRSVLHLQVSQASRAARQAVQKAGGSVTTVYYNPLGLKALARPDWFPRKGRLLPRAAQAPPRLQGRFDAQGQLPPDLTVPAAASAMPPDLAVPAKA